jgi:chemotaxis protein CheD
MTRQTSEKRISVVQGDYGVSRDPSVVLASILGSCVAACVRDPVTGIGGMNHFLLPGEQSGDPLNSAQRYGVHLMELLVNALLREGASRSRLEAKLFGGASVLASHFDVGARNGEFALRFLREEGIKVTSLSLGGTRGRKVEFWPVSGRARQLFMPESQMPALMDPREAITAAADADVEFF